MGCNRNGSNVAATCIDMTSESAFSCPVLSAISRGVLDRCAVCVCDTSDVCVCFSLSTQFCIVGIAHSTSDYIRDKNKRHLSVEDTSLQWTILLDPTVSGLECSTVLPLHLTTLAGMYTYTHTVHSHLHTHTHTHIHTYLHTCAHTCAHTHMPHTHTHTHTHAIFMQTQTPG